MNENKNITPVKIADLITENLQIRVEMQEESVENYAAIYREDPTTLPPVIVFHDSTLDKYYLADGFHRVAAAKLNGSETIDAEVKEGIFDDALRFALQANAKNGIRRTKADAIHAMEIVWAKWDTLYKNQKRTTENGSPSVRQLMLLCCTTNHFARTFIENKKVCESHTPPSDSTGNTTDNTASPNAHVLKNNTPPDATTVTREHLEERNANVRQNLKEHKDRYGMDIPERILPAFMSRVPHMLMRDIGNIRKAIERARDEQDLSFAHFYSYALTDIDNLLRDFRQGVPHCVCRMCRGRGCGSCSELGFQTKLQYDRNPPEFKA